MANKASAEKRARQALKRRARNRSYRSQLRSEIKKLRQAVDGGETATAQSLLQKTLGTVDRIAGHGVIHRNVAARTKSRLSRAVAALES
jgi:small subunit ribosomal protein S20